MRGGLLITRRGGGFIAALHLNLHDAAISAVSDTAATAAVAANSAANSAADDAADDAADNADNATAATAENC